MSNLAVIPARGGSKRLPRKNIREFGGKPMIAWTIEAAINSGLFKDVIVSTDDWEIAGISEDVGAEVYMSALHSDYMPTSEITLEIVNQYKGYVHVAQLMVTSPLRTFEDIQESFVQFMHSGCDAQISVSDFGWTNPWWAITEQGGYLFEDKLKDRSQDLPDLYCPTGAIWWTTVLNLIQYGTFYMPKMDYFVLPYMRGIDIDTLEDFEIADAFRRMNGA